jgi:hypothetical protein
VIFYQNMPNLHNRYKSAERKISQKNPEGQIARWFEILAAYDFEIEHRAGRSHANADAMSRRPCHKEKCSHSVLLNALL